MAVCNATKFALEHRDKSINIFTDSLSLVQILANPKFSIRINNFILEIRANVAEFYRNNEFNTNINIFWIPAHIGIEGNELADQTAKAATEKTVEDIDIPFTDLNVIHKQNMFKNNFDWIETLGIQKGSFYFQNYHTKKRKTWFAKCGNFKRELIVSIIRSR